MRFLDQMNTALSTRRRPRIDRKRFERWLDRHGFEPHPNRADAWSADACPLCGSEKRHRVLVDVANGRVNCWTCGGHRNLVAWVADVDGVTLGEAVAAVGMAAGGAEADEEVEVVVRELTRDEAAIRVEIPPAPGVVWPRGVGDVEPWMVPLIAAVEARGFSLEWQLAKRCGYCSYGMYADRVVIPVFHKGRFAWFQAWDTTRKKMIKYHSPAGVPGVRGRRELVYQLDLYAGAPRAAICEGFFNAWSAEQVGYPGLATMGKGVTPDQVAMLAASGIEEFVVALDADARDRALAMARELTAVGRRATVVDWPDDRDMNDHRDLGARRALLDAARVPDVFETGGARRASIGPTPVSRRGFPPTGARSTW